MAKNFSDTLGVQDGIALPSFIPIPPINSLVTAWASVVPLATHLATSVHGHELVGQIALNGKLSIDLCPRLGFYKNIYNLLSAGQSFYDEASSKAGLSMTVFDVNWGSIFPIANGDAFKRIVEFARSRTTASAQSEDKPARDSPVEKGWRRYQVLHVQRFVKKWRTEQHLPRGIRILRKLREFGVFTATNMIFRTVLVIGLVLIGCYGTATIVACTLFTGAISYSVQIKRPLSFLENNEAHDGYMLAACHANASEWYLLTGDRGVVDCLVNKPMIHLEVSSWLAVCFLFAEVVQLASMTFIAAVQGLDGVCMTALIVATHFIQWAYSKNASVAEWLSKDDIAVDSSTIVFSGRTQMLGAIILNGLEDRTAWLDPIVVDCPRRQVWLEQLRAKKKGLPILQEGSLNSLSDHDKNWVFGVTHHSLLGGTMIRNALYQTSPPGRPRGNRTEIIR